MTLRALARRLTAAYRQRAHHAGDDAFTVEPECTCGDPCPVHDRNGPPPP